MLLVRRLQNKPAFKSIGIAGLGLIGGSFAKAFAALGVDIYGLDSSDDTLSCAQNSGVFVSVTGNADTFLDYPLDLIYICLPVKASINFIGLLLSRAVDTAVTDSCSTKLSITESSAGLNFCGGHPIRGKEVSGFENSTKTLFLNAKHILTPDRDSSLVADLKNLHESIGMSVSIMSPSQHDEIFAYISHMPHLAAFGLIDLVKETCPSAFDYIGGGFRDFTRIAASDPIMWADIFLDNKTELLKSLDGLECAFQKWRTLINEEKYDELKNLILRTSNIRRGI